MAWIKTADSLPHSAVLVHLESGNRIMEQVHGGMYQIQYVPSGLDTAHSFTLFRCPAQSVNNEGSEKWKQLEGELNCVDLS